MDTKIELKPCPFCGSRDIVIVKYDDNMWAACKSCHVKTVLEHSEKSAINTWNRRTNG